MCPPSRPNQHCKRSRSHRNWKGLLSYSDIGCRISWFHRHIRADTCLPHTPLRKHKQHHRHHSAQDRPWCRHTRRCTSSFRQHNATDSHHWNRPVRNRTRYHMFRNSRGRSACRHTAHRRSEGLLLSKSTQTTDNVHCKLGCHHSRKLVRFPVCKILRNRRRPNPTISPIRTAAVASRICRRTALLVRSDKLGKDPIGRSLVHRSAFHPQRRNDRHWEYTRPRRCRHPSWSRHRRGKYASADHSCRSSARLGPGTVTHTALGRQISGKAYP